MTFKIFDYNSIEYGFYDKIFHNKQGVRSSWHQIKFNFIKNKIKNKNVHLDIGCGPGTFISLLKNKLSIGIDISSKQINFAKNKYGSKKRKFLLLKKDIPSKNNFYNSVSLIELIEHLSDKKISKLMNETYRVLKPGGKVYITTPNYLSLWPIIEIFVNKFSNISYDHQHINKFNKYNILKIINPKKFRVKKIESFMLISPFLAIFSFKFSIWLSKYERFITKFFPGSLIFVELEKK
ncbi:methyltransferase family protein [alpha proteobacterium HIMB5]|nr:methyltransferase family protein [alpha proteobacterium HIMB5]